nr:N-acetylneuraminate lyase isoform X7 [Anser cygnoides]
MLFLIQARLPSAPLAAWLMASRLLTTTPSSFSTGQLPRPNPVLLRGAVVTEVQPLAECHAIALWYFRRNPPRISPPRPGRPQLGGGAACGLCLPAAGPAPPRGGLRRSGAGPPPLPPRSRRGDSSMTPGKKLEGLVAATITPMTPDGQVNLSVIRQYVDYLVSEQNVKNIFVNGTTGEGLSLSIQERKQLAEEWVRQGKDKLDHVIVHVGALSLPESQDLARHAAAIGASGIAVIAPFFFKPTNKGFGVAQTKAVMTFVSGIPMGPPRPPLVNASEEFIAKAKAKLDSIAWPDGD